MASFGFPYWNDQWDQDYNVDWSSLPGEFESPDKKRLRRIILRDASGGTREVVIEEGINPRIIPPPGGKLDEPSDDPGVVKPPPTLESRMREQATFGDALKFGAGALLDPVGSVYGGEWAKDIVEDLVGEGESPLGVATRTAAEKGLQLASSPLTGIFAVPGVATSSLGRVAALGFGGMAAKGGGEQLGEALALAEDQGEGWTDPEVVRRLTSGGLDIGMAPLAAAGALHGKPMARVNRFGAEVIEPALERVAPYVERAARELGYAEPATASFMAERPVRPKQFATPEEEGAYLMDIINSDLPMSEKMMAQIRLEEITNPDIPPAEVVDQMNARDLPQILAEEGAPPPVRETVRPANVTPPPAKPDYRSKTQRLIDERNERRLLKQKELPPEVVEPQKRLTEKEANKVLAEIIFGKKEDITPSEGVTVQKIPAAGAGETVKSLNDVIDTMFGKGTRPKAAQVKEAREVYTKLVDEAKGQTPTMKELQAALEKRKAPEVPTKVETLPTEVSPTPEAPKVRGLSEDPSTWTPEEARIAAMTQPEFESYMAAKNKAKGPIKEKPLAEMTPEEMEAEAVAAEGKMREGKPAPDFERASTLRRLAEQKRTKVARDAQIEETRQKSAAATKEAVEAETRPLSPAKQATVDRLVSEGMDRATAEAEVRKGRIPESPKTAKHFEEKLGPVEPISTAYGEPIGPKRPRGRPPTPAGPVRPLGEVAPKEVIRDLRQKLNRNPTTQEINRELDRRAQVNPLEEQIPKATRPERVNPVEVFTGEKPEPAPVEPVKKPPMKQAQADVDTVSQAVEKETGIPVNKAPDLNTPAGKKFVKSFAKHMGVTEDKAAAMVGGQTAQKGSIPPAGAATPVPPGKTVPGAGKTVPAPPGGGPPPAGQPPTPRLPRPKGKRPSIDILEWMRQRRAGEVSQELTRRKFSNLPKGVQTQVDFEAGTLKLPEVRKWLDSKHRLMRKAGIDIGYVENYLTHLWKDPPSRVRAILGKRLGLKPGIAMTRSIPTLAEGIQKGLTPKFENMTDVLAWYDHATNKALADRGFFEWLREQRQIKPAGKAPHGWITLTPDRFPIRKWKGNTVQFKAPPEMATRINEYLYDIESDPRKFVQGLQKVAKFSRFLKNIRLAAGLPFTSVNMHSFSVIAHQVLSTPTIKGVIPNLPRMVGRGIKTFGEMLDPRLHRWTDKELRKAEFFQKYSPLTLSTEEHIFDPAIRGTLKARLAKARNLPEFTMTLLNRMYEEPLFQNTLPRMKLNFVDTLYKNFRKQGMDRRRAAESAGEVTNNFFGGLNLDEIGRDKVGQALFQVSILAPDWLEANLRTTAGIIKSPLGRTPKEKAYRDFAANLMGTYLAATFLQKALTGRWMHDNAPGNQFSIYLGKNPETKKDRYVKPYGAGLAGVRIIYDTAEATIRRQDIGRIGEVSRSRLSIPGSLASSVVFNKGPFGQTILKKGDTLGGQLMSVGELAAGQVTPQYVMGPVAALRGQISPELGLAQAIEFPYTEVKPRNPNEAVPSRGTRRRRRRRR